MILRLLLIIQLLLCIATPLQANPNQFGSTGLLHVPTADTLDSTNFCFGIWGNCSNRKDTGVTSIMPVTITLGMGTFWEVYGTYPNVYFGDGTQTSGRGTADIGTKIRAIGSRSSNFKLAADFHLSRYIDTDPAYNGKNDMGGVLIASLRSDLLAAHLYGGYMSNGDSRAVKTHSKASTEYPVGVGLDFDPSTRSKITFELLAADAMNLDAPIEASIGLKYYITPHLTANLSCAKGLNDAAPDWRVTFGLTTCQGVGEYIKPIPAVTRKGDKGGVIVKPTKVIPLTPLLMKTPELNIAESKLEVPVDSDGEEVLLRPYGNILIAQKPAASPVSLPKTATEATVIIPLPKNEPIEYSLTKVSGVTPIYGVRLKGELSAVEKPPGTALTVYRKFRLPDNLFEFDNADMIPEVQKSVSELAEFIRKDKNWVFVRIDGHTDAIGSVKYNMDLSLKRAITVANYLVTREGIDPSRIFVRGMGKSAPIADDTTDEGRKLNRRFEIVFLVHKENVK